MYSIDTHSHFRYVQIWTRHEIRSKGFILEFQDDVVSTLTYRRIILKINIMIIFRYLGRTYKRDPETNLHWFSACSKYDLSVDRIPTKGLWSHVWHNYGIHKTAVLPYALGDIESVIGDKRRFICWSNSFYTPMLIAATNTDIGRLGCNEKADIMSRILNASRADYRSQ